MTEVPTAPQRVPKSWANWRAHLEGQEARGAYEFDLYSDSVINGISRDFGPYRVMNLLAGERRETSLARPVATLRLRHTANSNPKVEEAEHGKRHPDEVAALMSLILGIRLQAGGATRHFDFRDDDRLGEPRAQAEVETPFLLPGAWTPIIAHAQRTAEFAELDLLESYPSIEPALATALMRAARLYQEALWLCEREAWLTWLLLVSAVETAANGHQYATDKAPTDLLRELDPKLATVAAKYGEDCVKDVAETQAKLLGATKKFLGFIEAFLPEPPEARPSAYQLEWTWKGLEGPLRQVYRMRSNYLHAGVPFPWQLRGAPEPFGGVPTEAHPDHIAEGRRRDHERLNDPELPMHVHVFEYIARGALLRWWKSLISDSTASATPVSTP